jgi:hypothetical protein
MKQYALVIGNGINNIEGDNSWDNLVHKIGEFCKIDFKIDADRKKHFPLLYEEIFLSTAKKTGLAEETLKAFIGQQVSVIKENDLHRKIRSLSAVDLLTTNYEFSLEGQTPKTNSGIIKEVKFSIFRHYRVASKRIWHIHGDCIHPNSINLGFEHYGGQLQQIRNYVASGTTYTSNKVNKLPLVSRLRTGSLKSLKGDSWVELFFTTDIHIIGLTLDYVETDLWWLLTFRARKIAEKRYAIKNKITYYIPKRFAKDVKYKLDLLSATSVEVEVIDKTDIEFYLAILNKLK